MHDMGPNHRTRTGASSDPTLKKKEDPSNGVPPRTTEHRWQESPAVYGIFLLLLLAFLQKGADILIPLSLAVLASLLLLPVVHFLARIHIPRQLAAAVVVIAIVSSLFAGMMILSGPAQDWLDKAPQLLNELELKLEKIKKPIEQVKKTAEQVEDLTEMKGSTGNLVVQMETGAFFKAFFSATPDFLGFLILSIVLVYFLLFTGETLAASLLKGLFYLAGQKAPSQIGHVIQQSVSRYLLTITLINTCLGGLTTLALYLIGLPNPALWGVLVAVFNYAPYIGAICSTAVITLVSIFTFDSLTQALYAPAAFIVLTILEGQCITPQVLGHRFSVNPLVVFLSMLLWGWLWGYAGVLLAVPMLVMLKIICESVDGFEPVVALLER